MVDHEDIDPDGDLVLLVGPEAVRFKVSRVAMRLASPVWKAMVSGRFSEGSASEVKLPEDDPDGLRIILLLAHLRFRRLPREVQLITIGHVAQLCDKYQTLDMARRNIIDWLEPHRKSGDLAWAKWNAVPSEYPANVRFYCSWIWLGWVLEEFQLFEESLIRMALRVPPANLVDLPDVPSGCKELLLQMCEARFQQILDILYNAVELWQSTPVQECRVPEGHWGAREKCTAARVGLVFRCLLSARLPLSPASKPTALAVRISHETFKTLAYEALINVVSDEEGIKHGACYPEFFSVRELVLKRSPLSRSDITGSFSKFSDE